MGVFLKEMPTQQVRRENKTLVCKYATRERQVWLKLHIFKRVTLEIIVRLVHYVLTLKQIVFQFCFCLFKQTSFQAWEAF